MTRKQVIEDTKLIMGFITQPQTKVEAPYHRGAPKYIMKWATEPSPPPTRCGIGVGGERFQHPKPKF